jgi:transposase-like protein
MKTFRWTAKTKEAAQLVARGELTYQEIADKVGVSRQTIFLWRSDPRFAGRVEKLRAREQSEVYGRGIALRENRVRALTDRWNRLRRIIEARADDPKMAEAAGGNTGLLAHTVKSVGSGDNAMIVDHYEVDAALLKELREHEKQAAQELGQWTEKREVTGANGGPVSIYLPSNGRDKPEPPEAGEQVAD